MAQLNRSINLLDGYIDLAEKDNFIAALPLLRLHLDTLQRMFAFQLIDKNIDEIVREILGGKQIKHYQNKFNMRKLTDAEINEQLSSFAHFSWVKNVYSAGNDFVHFSDKHILSSTIIEDKDKFSFSSTISLGSSYIAKKEKRVPVYIWEKLLMELYSLSKDGLSTKKSISTFYNMNCVKVK